MLDIRARSSHSTGNSIKMSKEQFWTLNVVGGICALLILGNLILGRLNEQANQTYVVKQNQLNRAQQMPTTLQNLAGRIARGGQTDPALKALLARQDIKINLTDPAGKSKPKP